MVELAIWIVSCIVVVWAAVMAAALLFLLAPYLLMIIGVIGAILLANDAPIGDLGVAMLGAGVLGLLWTAGRHGNTGYRPARPPQAKASGPEPSPYGLPLLTRETAKRRVRYVATGLGALFVLVSLEQVIRSRADVVSFVVPFGIVCLIVLALFALSTWQRIGPDPGNSPTADQS
jgi:hypothetical protein